MASVEPPPNRIEEILQERLPGPIREMRAFDRWFEPIKRQIEVAVTNVRGQVDQALATARQQVCREEGVPREVWAVTGTDGRSQMKSSVSIRSKLGREIEQLSRAERLPAGWMSEDQIEKMLRSFPDLGRFRILCDFTLDVERAMTVLLSPSSKLLDRYLVPRGVKDFTYDPELRRLARGHRAKQFAVQVGTDEKPILIEIQIMTLLQNIWDRRNHPLYEWEREGGSISPQLRVNDVALAETLHLVDLQATRNWLEFLEQRKGTR